ELSARERGCLAPADLPDRQNSGLLAGDAAVQARKMPFDLALERADERICQPGEGLARLLRGQGAREDARSDQKHLFLGKDAHPIEEILVRPGLAQPRLEGSCEAAFLR